MAAMDDAEGCLAELKLPVPSVHMGTSAAAVRGSERCRTSALCALAVVAIVGSALGVAGFADLAASPTGRSAIESMRRLVDMWSSEAPSADARALMATCDFDNQWMSTKWSGLSKQEKSAWTSLGWTSKVWDNSWGISQIGVSTTTTTLPPTTTLFGQTSAPYTPYSYLPMTEQTCWQDLDENRKDSAVALGYGIAKWMGCKQKNCAWPPGIPHDSAPCMEKMQFLEDRFNETRPWFNISQMKRDNLVLLGWDPDGNAWKNGMKPMSYGRPWSELTVREREAATFLGFSSKLWESCVGVVDSPCLQRLEHLQMKQRKWVWEELLPGTQGMLEDLGWQSRPWFEGETPAVMNTPWLGLTNAQRSAARILGYGQDTFRSCPDATCLDRFLYVQRRWAGVGWMQMKLSERRAWMLLGHTEELWESNNLPSTMQKRWEELTPEQAMQAAFLGHSEGTWQGCNTDWAGRNKTTGDNATMVDPSGAVRVRMYIDRPYSEISGNVYGKQVASMPTSFIRVFENAIARALFCGNPPLSLNPLTYIAADGEPLCVQQTNYEKQKYRIRVLNVVEGSIVVDFFIVKNATATQITSRLLFDALARQIDSKLTSPICHDKYFGRFAKKAVVTENKLSPLKWIEMQAALDFEHSRNKYTAANMCLLHEDGKLGKKTCGASSAEGHPRSFFSQGFAGAVLALLAMLCTPFA